MKYAISFQKACVLPKIIICQWRTDTVSLYDNMPLKIFKMYLKGSSSFYTNQQNHTDLLVSFLTDRRKKISVWLYWWFFSLIKRGYCWTYCSKIRHRYHRHKNKRWIWREGVPLTSHFKVPLLCTVVFWAWIHCHKINLVMTSYTISTEY